MNKHVYTDVCGNPQFAVIRTDEPKSFRREPRDGDCDVIYNLPQVQLSKWAVVCNGERDADILIHWGIPATTCPGGLPSWKNQHTAALMDKRVFLIREEGMFDHDGFFGFIRRNQFRNYADSLHIVKLTNTPGFGVREWVESEGGSRHKFLERLHILNREVPNV